MQTDVLAQQHMYVLGFGVAGLDPSGTRWVLNVPGLAGVRSAVPAGADSALPAPIACASSVLASDWPPAMQALHLPVQRESMFNLFSLNLPFLPAA